MMLASGVKSEAFKVALLRAGIKPPTLFELSHELVRLLLSLAGKAGLPWQCCLKIFESTGKWFLRVARTCLKSYY